MLISHYGHVYRLTKHRYFQLLDQIARSDSFDLAILQAKPLGNVVDLSDITPEDAKDMLNELKENA